MEMGLQRNEHCIKQARILTLRFLDFSNVEYCSRLKMLIEAMRIIQSGRVSQ